MTLTQLKVFCKVKNYQLQHHLLVNICNKHTGYAG